MVVVMVMVMVIALSRLRSLSKSKGCSMFLKCLRSPPNCSEASAGTHSVGDALRPSHPVSPVCWAILPPHLEKQTPASASASATATQMQCDFGLQVLCYRSNASPLYSLPHLLRSVQDTGLAVPCAANVGHATPGHIAP